jgi:nucleotide-binding universal stress UspA family protein
LIEIRTILAPSDFSAHAAQAVRYACALAERFGARLHLLHVIPDIVPAGPDPMLTPVLPPEYYTDMEAQSRATLDDLIEPSWGKATSVTSSVRWGNPVEEIVEEARTAGVDLLVIATHGRTGLSHVLLGSVAERIVREAPCPVLTIREREKP